MADMLVRIDRLPSIAPETEALAALGIFVRRVMPYEASVLRRFVGGAFREAWADEAGRCFRNDPASCYIAVEAGRIIGFAAYEVTRRGFFGPMGVLPEYRGRGLGRVLLIAALAGMAEMGYKYAVIGWVGPRGFYEKTVGAAVIPGSEYHIGADWVLPRG